MQPDVDFTLTEEGFRNYERLLAEQGIKACPMSRDTVEDLEQGTVSMFSIAGLLKYDGREFPYDVHQERSRYCLTVHAFDHGEAPGKAIVDAIRGVFPQPKRGIPARPLPKRRLNVLNAIITVGCVGFIIFFVVLCIFAYIGVRSFFW